MQNPFTLTFGKSPLESIERPLQVNEIIQQSVLRWFDTVCQNKSLFFRIWHRNGRFSSDHRHRNRNYYNITVREKSRKTCFNYY